MEDKIPTYCEHCAQCEEIKRLKDLLEQKERQLKTARETASDLRGQLIGLTQKLEY